MDLKHSFGDSIANFYLWFLHQEMLFEFKKHRFYSLTPC